MITRRVISLAVMGIFLVLGSVSTSKTLQPLWHFKIDDMIHFAMSANGEYIIVACEKGPLCDEGQYYIFDKYGNTVTHGCIESEITVVDIADNGAFFIGTRTGYYFRTGSGKIQKDLDMGILFQSVSMSENGQVVAGTDKEIFIFDEHGNQTKKEVGKPILNTAISASGNMAIAGSRDRIFLYKKSTDSWEDHPTVAKPVGLAISDNERVVVCGNGSGIVWIFDSNLRVQEQMPLIPGGLSCMAMTGDGKYLVCGSDTNKIIYFDTSGNEIWSSDADGTIKDIAVSFDGDLVVVLSENITFFDFKGKKIQELKSQNIIQSMQLSKFEKFLSYALNDELKFFDLYQQSYVDITTYMDTSEYPPPSRKSIPLDGQLEEDWSYGSTPYKVAVADVNQDGDNEIVCSFGNELIVLNSEGRTLWKESFSFEPLFFILDVTGDFVPEILVKSDDNRMEIQVFDGKGIKMASHKFYSSWYPVSPSKEQGCIGIFPLWSGNIDNDDSIEVICKLHAGYILKPRGLYAFEYPSFKEEWYYPVGPNLMTINVADIDNNGQAEIIAGSEAPVNGNQEGDTDDFHAYVFAVTLQGEEIWTEQIGSEGYKRIYVAPVDLNGDGNLEIVGAGWSSNDSWGTLFVMDSEGNYIQGGENEFNHSLFLKAITDLDNDGDLEILATTTSEFVIYNDKLREILSRNVSMTFSKHTQVTVNDIDADGEKEIILTSEDPKLLILNTDLEEKWSKIFPGYNEYLQAAVVNVNKCKNYLLVLSDRLYAYTYAHNPRWPCVPWIIAKEQKINEIETALEETQKYLKQGDLDKANEYVSQAEDVYISIRSDGGVGEYYEEIERIKKEIEASTPGPTSTPSTTPEPTETPEPTPAETPPPSSNLVSVLISVFGGLVLILVIYIVETFLEKRREEI